MASPKVSWILLGAIYGDETNPSHKINSMKLYKLIEHGIKSPSTFIIWKSNLVREGILKEEDYGNEKFYSLNPSKIFPRIPKEDLDKIFDLARKPVFRETIFNPKNYSAKIRFPLTLAFLFFFGVCTAYRFGNGLKADNSNLNLAQKFLLEKVYEALRDYKLAPEEEQEIAEKCKEVGEIIEREALREQVLNI